MKVKELMALLAPLHPEAEVLSECPDTTWAVEILRAEGVTQDRYNRLGASGLAADPVDGRVILTTGKYARP